MAFVVICTTLHNTNICTLLHDTDKLTILHNTNIYAAAVIVEGSESRIGTVPGADSNHHKTAEDAVGSDDADKARFKHNYNRA